MAFLEASLTNGTSTRLFQFPVHPPYPRSPEAAIARILAYVKHHNDVRIKGDLKWRPAGRFVLRNVEELKAFRAHRWTLIQSDPDVCTYQCIFCGAHGKVNLHGLCPTTLVYLGPKGKNACTKAPDIPSWLLGNRKSWPVYATKT
jgi:hypothetical protein